jgi:NitT/TauT family transport system permease protein
MIELNTESRVTRWGLSVVGVGTFFVLWWLLTSGFDVLGPLVLPAPELVIQQYFEFGDLILANFWPTFTASIVGFTSAVVLALIIGTALTLSDRFRKSLMPLILSGNAVPRVALAPLIIFYLGGGEVANYVIATWVAFFPMLVNTIEGLVDIEAEYDQLLETFNASTYQEYRLIRFPNALPFLFDGMKISISLAIVGAVVGEYVASTEGLGFLALIGLSNYNLELVFAVIAVMGVVAVVAFYGLFILQDRLVYWKETTLFSG